MCDATTLMIASTVVGVGGQVIQAQAQSDAYEYQAQVDRQNAILADRRAKDAIERGQLEEERAKREATALRKQQEASFSAANIDTSFGTPLDVIISSAMQGEQQAAIIRANAEREAEDFTMGAHSSRSQAALNQSSARNATTGGLFASVGTALDGGAGVFEYQARYG